MKKLDKPNNTVKNAELQKRWKDKMVLHEKMSVSNRPSVNVLAKTRNDYLSTKKLTYQSDYA